MIDLTPLEVRKKKGDFRRALRGYEPALVDDFLDIVADRLDQLVRENASLTDRVKRLEQQVAEYRDRERALTDALVTAQAMREEITERTTREAEAVRRTAQQEAESQLKDAVQQADTTVRDAEQRAEERLRRAQEEAETRLRRAEQEASARLREAEQEAYRLRAEAVRTRDHEEEALRRLRARQQQLVKSYRTFLQRELAELNTIAESLQPGSAEEPTADSSPAAEGQDSSASAAEAAATPTPSDSPAAAATPAAPPAPPPVRPGSAAAVAAEAPVLAEAIPEADEEEEPFAPEPVYDEDLLEDERLRRIGPVELLQSDAPEVSEESGEAVEAGWPDLDILPEGQEPDFSRPRPNPDALRLPYSEEDGPDGGHETGGDEAAEADPETEALLQNAARAGYRLDLDDEPELLLDEPVADEEGESDNWLDSIIEEEK